MLRCGSRTASLRWGTPGSGVCWWCCCWRPTGRCSRINCSSVCGGGGRRIGRGMCCRGICRGFGRCWRVRTGCRSAGDPGGYMLSHGADRGRRLPVPRAGREGPRHRRCRRGGGPADRGASVLAWGGLRRAGHAVAERRAGRSGGNGSPLNWTATTWRCGPAGMPTCSPRSRAQVLTHPLDERLAGQLMLALYRCGRQGDALLAFQEMRHRLVEELGADPSPPLRELHQQILAGDDALSVVPAAARSARGSSGATVPRQLPAPPRSFRGRTGELAELDALLAGSGEQRNAVVISAVVRGRRGGQDRAGGALGAPGRRPVPGRAAVRQPARLRPGGIADGPGRGGARLPRRARRCPQRVPVSWTRRPALYRSLLAGRRMLVVLDNARDADQVRPLLPGAPAAWSW